MARSEYYIIVIARRKPYLRDIIEPMLAIKPGPWDWVAEGTVPKARKVSCASVAARMPVMMTGALTDPLALIASCASVAARVPVIVMADGPAVPLAVIASCASVAASVPVIVAATTWPLM